MTFKMKGHTLPGVKQRKTTDMSKLRSKQARASKGVSEHQHFSKKGTQGDEPRVEYNMEKSPMKQNGDKYNTYIVDGKNAKEHEEERIKEKKKKEQEISDRIENKVPSSEDEIKRIASETRKKRK